MRSTTNETSEHLRLRKQRNVLILLTAMTVGSIGFALPRKISTYRELNRANTRLIELHATIVQYQQQIKDTQAQILEVQRIIRIRLEK